MRSLVADRTAGIGLALVFFLAFSLVLAGCATPPPPGEFENAELHGMIYDQDGTAVAWAVIRSGETQTVSDIRGRFSLPLMERGPVELVVTAEGHLPLQVRALFVNRTQVLHLTLTSRRTVAGQIREALANGDPEGARRESLRALSHFTDDPLFRYLLAVSELRAGRAQAAQLALDALSDSGLQAVDLLEQRIAGWEEDQ
jgi:hypothetical protein